MARVPAWCGDGRYLVAVAGGNGRVRLNAQAEIPLDQLALRIREVLRYRAEKLVFVAGEPEASWGDFITMVDRVWPESDLVSIVTPKVRRLAEQRYCLTPSCGRCERLSR